MLAAVQRYPDAAGIPARNKARLRALGVQACMHQQMVGEVARGLSLFGGASSVVRRCSCSVVD
jgi:hypothetical protein